MQGKDDKDVLTLSHRAGELTPSLTRWLFDFAKQYDDVVDLTLGDPDIIPPQEVRDAACAAIQEGRTRYSQNAGLLAAREAIARFNGRMYGCEIAADEVMVTCGGMEAIYLMLSCLVNPGDEVIIPAPYWINYKQMTQLCGGVPVIVPTREEDNFAITDMAMSAAITPRTKVLILNSPNNPTGRVVPGEVLDQLAKLAVEKNLFVISDEVYRFLIYDGKKHESIWTRPGMREHCAVVDSMSKRYSMTGYRLGCAIGPRDLISAMTRFQENVAACAPLPSQYAAIAAYGGGLDCPDMLTEFAARRQTMIDGIAKIPKLSLSAIDGTFYAFINISKTGLNSYDFAMKLLESQHVAVVSGRTYGDDYDGYVRIAFTVKRERLQRALNRIEKFVKGL